jgi:mono/diheme cytochrome c family protein
MYYRSVLIAFMCVATVQAVYAAAAQIEAGTQVYNNYCQTCHGDGLVSSGQSFDLRRLKAEERRRFETSVKNGKGQMPPWGDVLKDEEIDQLWQYVRANTTVK